MNAKPIKRTLSRSAGLLACAAIGFVGGKALAPHWFASPGPAKAFVLPDATPLAATPPTTQPAPRGPTTGPSKPVAKGTRGEADRHGSATTGD